MLISGCQRSTGSSHSCNRSRRMNSGRHCSRKPTPSADSYSQSLHYTTFRISFVMDLVLHCALCTYYIVLVARLMGSYAAIIGGTSGEALEDFTGGLLEGIDLTDAKYATAAGRAELFDTLLVFQERASLMGASISVLHCTLSKRIRLRVQFRSPKRQRRLIRRRDAFVCALQLSLCEPYSAGRDTRREAAERTVLQPRV